MSISEVKSQFKAELDLIGQARDFVYNATDANMWCSIAVDTENNRFMKITPSSTDPYFSFAGGSRSIPGLLNCENKDGFIKYMVNAFATDENKLNYNNENKTKKE
jgi:hypothetical protein